MLTVFKYVSCIIGFIVAILLLSAALSNLVSVKKKHYATFGMGMCIYMILIGVVIAALSGFFIAM